LHTYEVRLPDGRVVGNFILATQRVEKDPAVWEAIAVRSAGSSSVSRSIFAAENYQSRSARWFIDLLGDVSMTFTPEGAVKIVDTESGEEKGTYDHATSQDPTIPMLENEQAIQVMRALKQEIGTKQKTIICAGRNAGMPVSFDLEVTAHEEIETKAGKFDCAKIETSIKQTFYISRGEKREIVRMDVGAAKVDLVSTEVWDSGKPYTLKSETFGSSVTLPGPVIYCPPNVDDDVYRVQLFSSDFAGTWALLEINKKSNLVEEAQKGSREYALELQKGFSKKFDEFKVEGEWEEMDLNGVKAVAAKATTKKGDLTSHVYFVHAVSDDKAMSFRLNFAKPDEARALARAKEIVNGFRW
jgi:hypothetical protein